MKIEFVFNKADYVVDLDQPHDISIPLQEGEENPNCYWADPPKFETIVSGDFIGSVSEGGPVNYQKLQITPHGNGTHTECYGHISSDGATINQTLKKYHFVAELISVKPEQQGADLVIMPEGFESKIQNREIEALIVRTLPNSKEKLVKKYSGTNPPYFDHKCLRILSDRGVSHLLVDLPSVDRESDEGMLSAHKDFWNYPSNIRKHATITELIYLPDSIEDGLYLVNLQIISLETDACPSKPLLYRMSRI